MKGEYMKVGFIGAGNMATAMIGGMLQKGLLQAEDIIASSATQKTADKVAEQFGIKTTLDNSRKGRHCDPCDQANLL